MIRNIFMMILTCMCVQICAAQYKYEREYRIKKEKVPASAIAFVDKCGFTKKICWYREEGYDESSIEAKTKYRGQKYSIEFDTTGQLQDIEYKIKWNEITEEARSAIGQYFEEKHSKTTIKKIQRQLTGSDYDLQQAIITDSYDAVVTKYEIEVKVKIEGEYTLKEYLFDGEGKMMGVSEVIFRNSDNLEF